MRIAQCWSAGLTTMKTWIQNSVMTSSDFEYELLTLILLLMILVLCWSALKYQLYGGKP